MEGPRCRTSLWTHKVVLCLCAALCFVPGGKGGVSHAHSSLSVSAPHHQYICPEGATVKMQCTQAGAPLNRNDSLADIWLFTPHIDHECSKQHPRVHSPGKHAVPKGVHYTHSGHNFWVTLENLTLADQGRYCCRVLELKQHTHSVTQETHSHIVLTITPRRDGSQNCTVWDSAPTNGSVAVALAIAACILALLALPLILVLVYKQRQSSRSRKRGQELVRMDSEAHGHENPVFLGGSPQIKTRTISQIMTRQSSETGCHLLSAPVTPLILPAHGDVFFPSEDAIPESPEFLQA
ncbi:V-type immunoglobulin domain-containing suppressor of T-cell activation [Betta splendens]|uniref:V-type immunoglobulin domain-containing suppressor of T-cell activation n=1 Tax=Betta splendens TaxID=158456 RepID=UPI0010F9B8A3|nr:V-type immunoglobulin domain-containing suppressor of T-cell activation [Betta splendens]